MTTKYDNVEPVEGGSDGGRDADIYGPVAGDPDSRGRILVTTGDLLDNVKSSYATWEKTRAAGETFRVDQLVMVTHAPLSDAKRRNVLKYCEAHGLPAPHFWTQDWLVEALRKDPEWRVKLTGVRGRLEAISVRPVAAVDTPMLVGRTDALRDLGAAVDQGDDVSLVGLPGIGKSRLIAELIGTVHVIEPSARQYLFDDLFANDPATVVIDDTHLHLDLLEEMVRIRAIEQLPFRIVAVCWPGVETRVESVLTAPVRVSIDRLARGELDELIRQVGVHGFRARQLVLDQADGRPGWALTLSRLMIDGDGEKVMGGQFLLDTVAALTREIAGTEAFNDALACIAALGSASLEDLEAVADLVGVDHANLVAWLNDVSQGGMVARRGDFWEVFTALRPLMVASWFFGSHKTRSWSRFVARLGPDRRLDRTLLEVADLVPGREAQDLADVWFHMVTAAGDLNADLLELVNLYSKLSTEAADRAAALARTVLATPREPEITVLGMAYDPIGSAAVSVLQTAFQRVCSREATHGLLDLTIGDYRPRHQYPDHPIRVIQNLAQYLDPDIGAVAQLRERILAYSLEWFDASPTPHRWGVLAEVSGHVFDPRVEGSWTDPSSHRSLTLAQGLEQAETMWKLVELWQEIDARIQNDVGADVPHAAVAHLCGVFEAWSFLSVGHPRSGAAVTAEQRQAAIAGARRVLATLRYLAPRFPAVPIRVRLQIERLDSWRKAPTSIQPLPITDDRLARFVGACELGSDVEEMVARRRREQESLAVEVAGLGAAEGLAEFHRLTTEAQILDRHTGSESGEMFAPVLASRIGDAPEWLRLAIDAGVRSVVGPALVRARSEGADVAGQVRRALSVPALRPAVLRSILTENGKIDEVAAQVLADLRSGDAVLIGDLWRADGVTPMLRALLTHSLREIRALAAVSFGDGLKHGPPVPDDLRAQWRTALLDATPEALPHHSRWRLAQLLDHAVHHDSELGASWFIANADTFCRPDRLRGSAESNIELLRSLPRQEKRRVCVEVPAMTLVNGGYAPDLLGSDEELAAELLKDGVVDVNTLLCSLSGYRDFTVEGLAPVLLTAGVAPERIAERCLSIRETVGSVAASIRSDIGFFADLAGKRPELTAVCQAATARLEIDLDNALAEERMAKLQGW